MHLSFIFRHGDSPRIRKLRYGIFAAFGLAAWLALYHLAEPAASFATFDLLELTPASRLGAALQ